MTDAPDHILSTMSRLAEEIGERAAPPDFGEVTARARHRRRSRLVVAGALVAAVILAGVVGVALVGHERTPPPASPDRLPTEVTDLVRSPTSHPFEVVGGLDGSLAVVWRNLVHPEPTFALVLRDADGTVRGRLLDQPFDLTAVPGGWVASRDGASASFVTSAGAITELPIEPTRTAPEPGDMIVPTAGRLLLWRAETGTLALPDLPPRTEAAHLTDGGVLATYRSEHRMRIGDVRVSMPAGTRTVTIAGSGDHVSVLALGDAPDGSIPALGLVASHDAGRTGNQWTADELGLTDTTSLVVTPGGTTLSTSTDGDLTVLDADGRLVTPHHAPRIQGLTLAGDRVYGFTLSHDGALLWSEDDGATWRQETMPGLE
jgi:hypothetical protein